MSRSTEIDRVVLREPNRLAAGLMRLPAVAVLALIRLYQRTLSPLLPVVTAGACVCRFLPTCSHYAAQAIHLHGVGRGTWLAVRRLVKCTPLHPGGLDPVPLPTNPRPKDQTSKGLLLRCDRVVR